MKKNKDELEKDDLKSKSKQTNKQDLKPEIKKD